MTRINAAVLTAVLCLSACSTTVPRDRASDATVGAVAGAAVGAGTGAIVASAAGNDVATSALIGTGAGAVAGVLVGLGYSKYAEVQAMNANDEAITANELSLRSRQKEINQIREEIYIETRGIQVNEELGSYRYDGPTYGDPRRPGR